MISVWAPTVDEVLNSLGNRDWPAWIDTETKSRIQRLHRCQDRRRSLAGHVLARTMIAAQIGIPVEEIRVNYDRFGKPELLSLNVFYNLAHCGDRVACALGSVRLGIDLEQIRNLHSFEEICKKVLTPREQRAIESAEDRLERFFEFWTLKESYVKATGRGLSHPLASFELERTAVGWSVRDRSSDYSWSLSTHRLRDGYWIAVCADTPSLGGELCPFEICLTTSFPFQE